MTSTDARDLDPAERRPPCVVVKRVDAVERQPEAAHQLAVEPRRGCRGDPDLDAAVAVDRRAVGGRLARADLRGADAAGVDARRRDVLDAPEGAVGVGDVVEGRALPGATSTARQAVRAMAKDRCMSGAIQSAAADRRHGPPVGTASTVRRRRQRSDFCLIVKANREREAVRKRLRPLIQPNPPGQTPHFASSWTDLTAFGVTTIHKVQYFCSRDLAFCHSNGGRNVLRASGRSRVGAERGFTGELGLTDGRSTLSLRGSPTRP